MNDMTGSVVTNGFETKYIRFGTGNRKLVILPGLSVQSVMPAAASIKKQYEIFCGDFTVWLFDRRSGLPDKYTVCDMANDAAAAMSALGLENVCLFGTSQGGMMAQVIAADHPGLVNKLALGSSACLVDEERCSVIDEWVMLAKQGKKKELYLSFGEKVYPAWFFEKYRDAFAELSKSVTDADLARFVILAEGTRGFDVRDRIGSINCPVLAVGDDSDAVLGAAATDDFAAAFSGRSDFELLRYSSFGHAVYDTAPDFKKKLFDFFIK